MNPFYFATFSRPGMNFSFSTYEMTNGSLQSSMNCLMNQAWADMGARRELYFYPQYSFNNFSEYMNNFSNNYLLDINYTLGQYHFNSLANGGQGLFGWNAVPTFNNNNQWSWTPWGWQGGNNGGSQAGSSSDKDQEFKADYETLKTLLETYRDKGSVGKSTKTKIDEALGKTGTYEERLDALKSVYKKLNKNSIKKVIAFLPEYKTELENAGYKMSSTDVSNTVTALEDDIKGIKDSNEEYIGVNEQDGFAKVDALAKMDDGSANNILAIISKWNDTHNGNETCIIGAVLAKTNNKNKDNNYTKFVTPLVNALKNKAEQVKDNCDETTIKNIDKVVSDLTKATHDKNNTSVTTNFKKLYVMLRDIEAKRINRDIQDEYKFLNSIADDDTDIINNNLIIDETKADLKAEGLENDYNAIKDDIALNERDVIIDEGGNDDENETTADKMTSLVSDGTLITKGATADGETIYEETTVAEGATKRQFIIRDEKVYVYKNGVVGDEVTPQSIKDAKKAVDNANAAAAAQEAEQENTETDKQKAYNAGKLIASNLRGARDGNKNTSINNTLKGDSRTNKEALNITKDNVVDFLDGLYSEKKRGYFERMEKRRKKGEIDIEKRLEILDAVLKAAEEKGLENDESYLTLRKIYEAHNDSKTNFNNKNKTERNFWKFGDKATSVSLWGGGSAAAVTTGLILASNPGGWLIAGAIALVAGCTAIGFALGKRSDAEVIDDCIKDLHKKLKAQEAPAPKAQAPEAQTVTDIAAPVDTTIQSTPADTTAVAGARFNRET